MCEGIYTCVYIYVYISMYIFIYIYMRVYKCIGMNIHEDQGGGVDRPAASTERIS